MSADSSPSMLAIGAIMLAIAGYCLVIMLGSDTIMTGAFYRQIPREEDPDGFRLRIWIFSVVGAIGAVLALIGILRGQG